MLNNYIYSVFGSKTDVKSDIPLVCVLVFLNAYAVTFYTKPTKRWLLVLNVGRGIEFHGKFDVDMASPMTIDRHITKFVSD